MMTEKQMGARASIATASFIPRMVAHWAITVKGEKLGQMCVCEREIGLPQVTWGETGKLESR